MFPSHNPLTLGSMIGKLNKTLTFANQVIPLYVKAKPILSNAKDALKVAKVLMEKPKAVSTASAPVSKKTTQPSLSLETTPMNKPTFFL